MGLCVELELQLVVSMRPMMFAVVIHLSEWVMCFRWPCVAVPNLYIVPLVKWGNVAQLLEHFRVIQVFGLEVEKKENNEFREKCELYFQKKKRLLFFDRNNFWIKILKTNRFFSCRSNRMQFGLNIVHMIEA